MIVVLATFNYIPFKKESFTMSTATTNKLNIKDIITVVLLALINVVIFFASSVLYATPVTIILMPVFFAFRYFSPCWRVSSTSSSARR